MLLVVDYIGATVPLNDTLRCAGIYQVLLEGGRECFPNIEQGPTGWFSSDWAKRLGDRVQALARIVSPAPGCDNPLLCRKSPMTNHG